MGYVFFIVILGLTVLFIPFSPEAASGAADGLKLFAAYVLPALFPFFVCSHYLTESGVFIRLTRRGRLLPLLAAPLTALCGTPSSALITERMYASGCYSRKKASMFCAALNQTGPSFIISSLCLGMLKSPRYAAAFLISHYAPAFAAAVLLSFFKDGPHPMPVVRSYEQADRPLAAFSKAISGAVVNVLRVGGTVVFFRSVYSVLSTALSFGQSPAGGFITGLFEMTSGVSVLVSSTTRLSLGLCAFLISFGGACIFIQSKMIFEELSSPYYFITKLAVGAASFAVFTMLCPAPETSQAVFGNLGEALSRLPDGADIRLAAVICTAASVSFTLAVSMLFSILSTKRKQAI